MSLAIHNTRAVRAIASQFEDSRYFTLEFDQPDTTEVTQIVVYFDQVEPGYIMDLVHAINSVESRLESQPETETDDIPF